MTGFNFPGGGVVTSPNAPEELPSLLQQIELQSKLFAEGDAEARLKLVDTARSLSQAMETPRETLLRYCWGQVNLYPSSSVTAVKWHVDWWSLIPFLRYLILI